MSILVTGASGLLGRAIARSFAAEGVPVRLVGRDIEKLRRIHGARVDAIAWEPAFSEFPATALDGIATVFHLMGEPLAGRWTKTKRRRIFISRATSAQKLALALSARGRPCRLVSASSFAIYPGVHGDVYDETPRPAGNGTFIQATVRAWESAALSAAHGETRVSVIRFGMVCGPDAYPKRLVPLFKRGAGFIVGDGARLVPIVDIEDAVAMMRWVAERHIDGVINCVAPALPPFRDIAQSIAHAVGQPIRFTVPDWIARALIGGSADIFLRSYDMRPARALSEGFVFGHVEPRAILSRALASYATSGRTPGP